MPKDHLGILAFEEGYFERIWGGRKLETVFGMAIPADKPIGEAWLVADHGQHVSVVADGPHAGRSLRELIEEDGRALLGSRAALTVHGRFPLLLKILDAADVLSVQVHPDDGDAKRLNEPDVGKTEMWHVLEANGGSELICGMVPGVDREGFEQAVANGTTGDLLRRFEVSEGTSVFVAAGTVHAIGAGILLAEIQQNSDLTYRIHDWGRVQDDGTPRELHVEKALEVVHFGSGHGGGTRGLEYAHGSGRRVCLGACGYFAAELVEVDGRYGRDTFCDSFHLLLGKSGELSLGDGGEMRRLVPGQALVIPGSTEEFSVEGQGAFLDYYVPHLARDVVAPLLACGHGGAEVVALGGDPASSDLAALV